jgi:glutathione peroxidase
MNIYDFSCKSNNGEMISLSKYKGKVLLIVNTATHCGFTPTYKALEELYEAYKPLGLEILDFPL